MLMVRDDDDDDDDNDLTWLIDIYESHGIFLSTGNFATLSSDFVRDF